MTYIFDSDIASFDDMTEFIRLLPTPPGVQLLAEFPRRDLETNTFDWSEITKTNRTARYRAYDGRVHVSARDGGTDNQVSLIPLSTSLATGELERLQLEFARFGGTRMQAVTNAAYDDTVNLTREVQNRLEQAWGDVLEDGKLTIEENGLALEADFGLPAEHQPTAEVLWDHVTDGVYDAGVLSDLSTWNEVYLATNGFPATTIKTSRVLLRTVLRNAEVIDAVYGSTAGRTRVSLQELNQLLADEGLPVFGPTYDYAVDVDGTTKRVLPENKLVMLPSELGQLGSTVYGVSATALDAINSLQVGMSFEEAAGIVGVIVVSEGVPKRQHVYVDAVAMPVLTDARRLLSATVLAAG